MPLIFAPYIQGQVNKAVFTPSLEVPPELRIPPGRLKKTILPRGPKTAAKRPQCMHTFTPVAWQVCPLVAFAGLLWASHCNRHQQCIARGFKRRVLALLGPLLGPLGPPYGPLAPLLGSLAPHPGRLGASSWRSCALSWPSWATRCLSKCVYIYTYIERNWYLPQVAFLIFYRPAT